MATRCSACHTQSTYTSVKNSARESPHISLGCRSSFRLTGGIDLINEYRSCSKRDEEFSLLSGYLTQDEISSFLSFQEKSQPALAYQSPSTFCTELRNIFELSPAHDKMDNPLFMSVPTDALPQEIKDADLPFDCY